MSLLIVTACYYDVEEDFAKEVSCEVSTVSYLQDVAPIIANRCLKCHSAALRLGNVDLEGHGQMAIYAENGRLLGAVKRLNGFSPMPQNEAMLPDCDIMKIDSWIQAGAPNN